MKKLMILGAGAPQARLAKAAKELGCQVIMASIPGNYPGFAAADVVTYTDISDPEAVLAAAREYAIDGIATCCLDTGIKALGYVCEKMGLPGLSAQAALCCNDKYAMKQAFVRAGVKSARFIELRTEEELAAAAAELGYPCVLKALDLQGSKGVFICRTREQLEEAFAAVRTQSRLDHFILEEYISGYELGAQAFVYQGEILYILPHGDYTYMSKTAIPVGHFVPAEISPQMEQEVLRESEKAIRALGLDNCAVNIDLIEKDGGIYVIELTGRAGATCLPELVSIYYGLDYYRMIVLTAMGEDPRPFFAAGTHAHTANASHMLISEKTGTVTAIRGAEELRADPEVYELSLLVGVGDHVDKYTSAKDRIGQVITQGPTYAACKEKLDHVLNTLEIAVE